MVWPGCSTVGSLATSVGRWHGKKGHVSQPMSPPLLSKSRFVAGMQCHNLLWWKAHEPDAIELQPLL